MKRMRALRKMRYGTRRLVAGDVFEEPSRRKAKIYAAVGLAEYHPDRMPAEIPAPPADVAAVVEDLRTEGDELEALRAEAEARGLEYSPRLRAPGLRKLLSDG